MASETLNLGLRPMSEVVNARRVRADAAALAASAAAVEARLTERARTISRLDAALEAGARGRQVPPRLRAFEAAKFSRLTSDWVTAPTSGNYELRAGLRNLRARSRDLARNDPWIAKFLDLVVSNVVGPRGISLQVRARGQRASDISDADKQLYRSVEEAFAEWSHAETASADGRKSWADMQRLFMRTTARDGEPVVRMVAADNRFGFSLDFLDANYLDETQTAELGGGARIMMGVEVNGYNRPVAYHLTTPAYDYYPGQRPSERVRVPASEIIHAFIFSEDGAQVRGVPWAHAVMERLRHLGQYNLAEIVAAREAACKGGVFTAPASDENGGVQFDDDGNPIEPEIKMEPGAFPVVPYGWTFTQYDPKHPNQDYGAFEGAMMRGIASGLPAATYFELANDLTAVNFSSARIGLNQARRVYRALQYWLIEHFNRPVFMGFLRAGMMTGAVPITVAQYERLKEARWQPPGFDYTDPLKDVTASLTAIKGALSTHTRELAERGEDFEDIVEQLAYEQAYLKEKDVVIDTSNLGALAALAAAGDATPPEK